MRPRARAGQPTGVELRVSLPRAGNRLMFEVTPTLKELILSGQPARLDPGVEGTVGMIGSGGLGTITAPVTIDAPIGRHRGQSLWSVAVMVGGARAVSGRGTPTATFDVRQDAQIEIVPPDQPLVTAIIDEPRRAGVERSIAISRVSATPLPEGPVEVSAQITITDPPVGLAFDISFLDPDTGREWPMGGIAVPAAKGHRHSTAASDRIPGFTARRLEVILRPNIARAEATTGIDSIWGDEVVIRDLDVSWPDEAPAGRK
jgi:hypothetical protein